MSLYNINNKKRDELHLKECKDFEELKQEIDDYMDYYNNYYRYQWDLKNDSS